MLAISKGAAIIGTDNARAEPNEQPEAVIVLKPYRLEQFEVTYRQYRRCVEVGGCSTPLDYERFADTTLDAYPIQNVTALQAAEYCQWVGRRLPTELEWERAARGTTGNAWPWGRTPPAVGSVQMATGTLALDATVPVTTTMAGAAESGFYHLVGNLWEWTASYPTDSYRDYDQDWFWDSTNYATLEGSDLILRGGSYDLGIARITEKFLFPAFYTTPSFGFRCAADG